MLLNVQFIICDLKGFFVCLFYFQNARQLPTSTPVERTIQKAELRIQFPVSSGSHHRVHEEWVPVEKTTTKSHMPPPAAKSNRTPASTTAPPAVPTTAPSTVVTPEQPSTSSQPSIFPDAPKEVM